MTNEANIPAAHGANDSSNKFQAGRLETGVNHEFKAVIEQFLRFSPRSDEEGSPASETSGSGSQHSGVGSSHSDVASPDFDAAARVFFAPGRVNLIGEHTDYNGGYVLPAALNIGTWLFVRRRNDGMLRFASTSFEKIVEVPAEKLTYQTDDDYANYPKGVIHEFEKRGFEIPGLDLFYYGNLPNGAGLSSSASMEVVTACMMNELLGAGLSREELALLAQAAENQFVGVNCGIMDQFAVALGKEHQAISLNCDTLAYQLVPMQIDGVSLIIANTNKRRGLTDSKYNERRSECEAALGELRQVHPEIKSLGEIDEADWAGLEGHLSSPLLQKRARHVVLETNRAKRAAGVLQDGDITEFGRMMNASHVSLRDDYEVTGAELDALVEAAWAVDGCIGSRMTGAGFGGCTVSLVAADKVEEFVRAVGETYTARIGYAPSFYVTDIGDGVKEVTNEVLG